MGFVSGVLQVLPCYCSRRCGQSSWSLNLDLLPVVRVVKTRKNKSCALSRGDSCDKPPEVVDPPHSGDQNICLAARLKRVVVLLFKYTVFYVIVGEVQVYFYAVFMCCPVKPVLRWTRHSVRSPSACLNRIWEVCVCWRLSAKSETELL